MAVREEATPEGSEAERHMSMAYTGAAFLVPPEPREPRVGLAALPGTCWSMTQLHQPLLALLSLSSHSR